jgi:hypothetical protein
MVHGAQVDGKKAHFSARLIFAGSNTRIWLKLKAISTNKIISQEF